MRKMERRYEEDGGDNQEAEATEDGKNDDADTKKQETDEAD
jgi:hypothetical protein